MDVRPWKTGFKKAALFSPSCWQKMGGFQSKNGIKNAIIGDETIAKCPLPEKDDNRWEDAGEVSNLYIYPVKSFYGTSVETAKVEKHGLQNGALFDRQFIGMFFWPLAL